VRHALACGSIHRRALIWLWYRHHAFDGKRPHYFFAMRGDDEQTFRRHCINALTRSEALDFMIDTLKAIAMHTSTQGQP